jgi:hypothetical protein
MKQQFPNQTIYSYDFVMDGIKYSNHISVFEERSIENIIWNIELSQKNIKRSMILNLRKL